MLVVQGVVVEATENALVKAVAARRNSSRFGVRQVRSPLERRSARSESTTSIKTFGRNCFP
jgi:hypothetical protein